MVLKIKTFLTNQNLTKNRELSVICSEVQEFGVVKTYLGILSPHIDLPDIFANFVQIFQKNVINSRNAQKVLRVYVDQSLEFLPHLIKIPILPPPDS